MKTILYLGLAALALNLSACKKDVDLLGPTDPTTSTGSGSDEPGLVTPVGKPLGVPVTQTIGTSGGSLTTPDGTLTLEIPAGALGQSTALTLQLLEKTLPSGAGPAFTLSPKSTKLNKSVSVVWHYTAQSMAGSAPEVVGIAFQGEDGIWQGRMNTIVDKAKQTITARVRNFAHPMSWYEQYFMTPVSGYILPNERVDFRVFFQPGRMDTPSDPDDDIFVPLPGTVEGDDALHQLAEKELRSWKLNGQIDLPNSDDRRYVLGSLTRLGSGGTATYQAPRSVPPQTDSVLAVSVELNLKQKGTITMVSNLRMIDDKGEFKVGGKTYLNPQIQVIAQNGEGCSINLTENNQRLANHKVNLSVGISPDIFSGTGTYELDAAGKNLNVMAFDGDDNYGIQWVPQPGVLKYGPATVTITEHYGPGYPVAGRISATLHRYIESTKSWEHINVSGKFRVTNNYFTGSGG